MAPGPCRIRWVYGVIQIANGYEFRYNTAQYE
jgi:hypothetical protein